ncbi:protein NUCLEAR FUSION DEFECTIVE 4-like isoform X2 [Tasmannia lanceolata]|uniref:protein NUCLEAR FUSION DEFECTIVE 4-like isoform X2 n=1 Tax=Tasmannia lanceolata TaxID=3420 RepID=UPI004064630F
MDDTGGHDLDPGLHGYQFRFLFLFVRSEIGAWDLTGSAQLFGRRIRPWKDSRMVFRTRSPLSPLIGCPFHGCFNGSRWIRIPVAPHTGHHFLAIFRGCSICWFNTVCFVLCVQNFPVNRSLALALTISFNGVSPTLYTLAANAISSSDDALYLLLNAFLPLFTSVAAVVPILRHPPSYPLPTDAARRDSLVFLVLNIFALLTGIYLLFLSSISSAASTARLLFSGAILLLFLPLCIPGIVYARNWARRTIHSSFRIEGSGFNLVDADNLELHKELLSGGNWVGEEWSDGERLGCCERVLVENQLVVLGEEHSVKMVVRRIDFWLYYLAYFLGATIGLVYSNNLGQIAQSLGFESDTTNLVTLYSACSFFGRLLSAVPDFVRGKVYFARTGWLAIALTPTPIAFLLLATTTGSLTLQASTALVGLSSGFIFAAAVSVTSELFGPNSMGVNHNIVITNIPIGSLLYGSLAAVIYDAHGKSSLTTSYETVVCTGKQCYMDTFVLWGCISMAGLVTSVVLFLRTKPVYDRFERTRILTQLF